MLTTITAIKLHYNTHMYENITQKSEMQSLPKRAIQVLIHTLRAGYYHSGIQMRAQLLPH